jgi:hypothetical protein
MKENPSNSRDPLLALPAPTGPYRVGTEKYDLEDLYRKDFLIS